MTSTMQNLPARPPVYATVGELPNNANDGAMAIVLSIPPAIYLYDGTEWNFAGGGTTIEQILGTTNQIDVTPGGAGVFTLSTPQDLDINANFEVNSISVNTSPVTGKSALINMPGAGTTRYGLQVSGVTQVASGQTIAGFILNPDIGCNSGILAVAYTGYINPIYSGNSATISDTFGLFIDGGGNSGVITRATNLRVKVPASGDNKYTAYFDPGVGIGAATTDVYTMRINGASNPRSYIGLLIDGTYVQKDPIGSAMVGFLGQMTFSAPTGADYIYGMYSVPTITTPLGQTINYTSGFSVYPFYNTNAGHIVNAYSLLVESGSTGSGTIDVGYGLFVETPTFGAVQICAGFEGPVQYLTNSTGAATCSLSNNSPATIPGAPFTWIHAYSSNGTLVYIPAWK